MKLEHASHCALLLLFYGLCLAAENNATREDTTQKQPIVEVCLVGGMFVISGGKPTSWDDVQRALETHRKVTPGAKYEFISRGKLPIESCLVILEFAKCAGISFEHFWVPLGDIDEEEKQGKHGKGIIDIVENLRAEAAKIKRVDKAIVDEAIAIDSKSDAETKSVTPTIKKE